MTLGELIRCLQEVEQTGGGELEVLIRRIGPKPEHDVELQIGVVTNEGWVVILSTRALAGE